MDVTEFRAIRRGILPIVFLAAIVLGPLLSVQSTCAQNLLVNGDFSQGSDNQPGSWRSETWIDLPTTTFAWLAPSGGESGQLQINNDKLNDSRWTQTVILEPALYYAGAEISTQGVPPQSWAGALVSVGDQSVASMDVKGDSNWSERGVFFKVDRAHSKVDVKLRLAGFKNFASGQASFRSAVLYKLDSAPKGAMVLDLDADTRLWAGNGWTILPVWIFLLGALVFGWRLLGAPPIIADESPGHQAPAAEMRGQTVPPSRVRK